MIIRQSAIVGVILGTAVGDALGLPYEGLSPRRAARMLGAPDRYRLLFGRGMTSDDTEHTCMVAQALVAAGDDVDLLAGQLARRLRWWLAGLPAGIGLATLRATLRLWLGYPPQRSGVFSAGNGPAMRSAILGATVEELPQLWSTVSVCTRITHCDPKAVWGAWAVALAARFAAEGRSLDARRYAAELRETLANAGAAELLDLVDRAVMSAESGADTSQFAAALGLHRGVSGYVYHTVPVVLHAWFRHPRDFRTAVTAVIRCGGDADTTAALVGGIVGAGVGKMGIPADWLAGLADWPRSVRWMEHLAARLYDCRSGRKIARPPRLPLVPLLLRNSLFTVTVLVHGFRRLLPPY